MDGENWNFKKIYRFIFVVFLFAMLINSLYGASCGGNITCSCGDTIVSNYIMEEDLFCEGNAFVLKANLNCDKYSITGSGYGKAVYINGYSNRIIENCQIENFGSGVYMNSRSETYYNYPYGPATRIHYPDKINIKNNVFKDNSYGVYELDSNYNNITGNIFDDNRYGIYTKKSSGENIYDNKFVNNSIYGIYFDSKNSEVWDNNFVGTGIFYKKTGSNLYCREGVDNDYFEGAKGPLCDCLLPYDDLVIDSDVIFCSGDYNMSGSFYPRASGIDIDCRNSIFLGDGTNIGFKIDGYSNINIKNCNLENFNYGIYMNLRYENYYNYPYGLATRTHYSKNNNVSGGEFMDNNYGIYINSGENSGFFENKFINSSVYGIYLKSGVSANSWGNLFYDTGIYSVNTKGKSYCFDNVSNLYFNGAKGSFCDCVIPHNNLIVDSEVIFCSGEYDMTSYINLNSNSVLDCNGAVLNGGGSSIGIYVNGASNTVIQNCVLNDYTSAVKYAVRTQQLAIGRYKYYKALNNELYNSTFFDVRDGVVMGEDAFAGEVHNSIFLANRWLWDKII